MHTFDFDSISGRYSVDGRDIHCGDVTEIFRGGKWEAVRWEMTSGRWYVITETGNAHPEDGWAARWPVTTLTA